MIFHGYCGCGRKEQVPVYKVKRRVFYEAATFCPHCGFVAYIGKWFKKKGIDSLPELKIVRTKKVRQMWIEDKCVGVVEYR